MISDVLVFSHDSGRQHMVPHPGGHPVLGQLICFQVLTGLWQPLCQRRPPVPPFGLIIQQVVSDLQGAESLPSAREMLQGFLSLNLDSQHQFHNILLVRASRSSMSTYQVG